MKPTLKLKVSGPGTGPMQNSLSTLTRKKVLVGVPATSAAERQNHFLDQASKLKLTRKGGLSTKARKLIAASMVDINNAQLVYIHTNGSPLRRIPARPIIEPAIEDRDNQAILLPELQAAAAASLDDKPTEANRHLKRAALLAEGLVRAWFTNPRNRWAPNAPSTVRRKKSSRPLIDTASMRKSIVGLVVGQ